jgi:hypothetical protein
MLLQQYAYSLRADPMTAVLKAYITVVFPAVLHIEKLRKAALNQQAVFS